MDFSKGKLNTLNRAVKKASYDKKTVYDIVDAVEICHIAFSVDGLPMVQPINFGRLDDTIYIHGSHQNRMTHAILNQDWVCINVMLLDSMKITRSAFHHSVNFRSAVLFGKAREITTHEEKLIALKTIINHFIPNRWDFCRPPTVQELDATRVIAITIETASAKIANTPPVDNKEDLNLDYWAGEISVKQTCGFPVAVDNLNPNLTVPQHILDFYNTRK